MKPLFDKIRGKLFLVNTLRCFGICIFEFTFDVDSSGIANHHKLAVRVRAFPSYHSPCWSHCSGSHDLEMNSIN